MKKQRTKKHEIEWVDKGAVESPFDYVLTVREDGKSLLDLVCPFCGQHVKCLHEAKGQEQVDGLVAFVFMIHTAMSCPLRRE